jgi:hypothetical protein
MNINLKDVVARVTEILRTGASLDKVARYLNAEFHISAYVNKNKLWGQYKDEEGKQQARVLA